MARSTLTSSGLIRIKTVLLAPPAVTQISDVTVIPAIRNAALSACQKRYDVRVMQIIKFDAQRFNYDLTKRIWNSRPPPPPLLIAERASASFLTVRGVFYNSAEKIPVVLWPLPPKKIYLESSHILPPNLKYCTKRREGEGGETSFSPAVESVQPEDICTRYTYIPARPFLLCKSGIVCALRYAALFYLPSAWVYFK